MIKKKLIFVIVLLFLLVPMISAYTIYNSSAETNVIFMSLGLNSQITTTFVINFSEADVTSTNITFHELTYIHPLSCGGITEYVPIYVYTASNQNITTHNFSYTACFSPPTNSNGGDAGINTNISLTYDKDWLFNVENQIKLEVYNSTNKSVNASFIKVFVNNLNSSQVPQFVSYNYTTKTGTYIFKYTIPLQNITSVVFTFQVNKDGYNIIKTATINISDGKGKTIIPKVPNILFLIAVIGLMLIVILFLYWKYRKAKHRNG